jgi:HSP20 family protein
MALIPYRRKERGDLANLHREMDDLFNSFFGAWPAPVFDSRVWPAIDVNESENEITVTAEVPGCKAEDVDISVHGNTLIISGEKKQQQEKKEQGYYHVERSYGSFRRELTLPADAETDKIEAVCKDGVLKVVLPKAERAKAVKVKIKGQ